MHARYYKPILGRFMSVDPIGGDPRNPQSWNRYSYVLGNPVNYVDPFGMWQVDSDRTPPAVGMTFEDVINVTGDSLNGFGPVIIKIKNPGMWKFLNYRAWVSASIAGTGGKEPSKQTQANERPTTPRCPSYWQYAVYRFNTTNAAIPGLLAPASSGLVTTRYFAQSQGFPTFLQWARAGFGGLTVSGVQLSALEAGVWSGAAASLNFVFAGVAYESGLGAGSLLGAGVDAATNRNCVE